MDFYKLQKEAIEAYVNCFNFFFGKVWKRNICWQFCQSSVLSLNGPSGQHKPLLCCVVRSLLYAVDCCIPAYLHVTS
jgi:hypothetical protein